MDKLIPGTNKAFTKENAFESYKEMIELTNGLSLGQVCSITNLDSTVIQNWVKRGYVSRPIKKKYYEKQLARILMINSFREAMKIEDIGRLMKLINGDVEDESDDLLSEEKLYTLFSKVVFNLESFHDVDKTIKKIMKQAKLSDEKLLNALETMVYAYIASENKKASKEYLKLLAQEKPKGE